MEQKIAFFTEGMHVSQFGAPQDRNHTNCRTDVAWQIALEAIHFPITLPNQKRMAGEYDLGIVILPKKGLGKLMTIDFMDEIHRVCKKVAIMQEGPNWNWQDYTMEEQMWYYNTLMSADFLLCHNNSDINYYKGLTGKNTYVMQSLMIEDTIKEHASIKENRTDHRKRVMIGGNMCSWYGGFDSMIVANEFDTGLMAPSMGRKIPREDELDIKYLPYMDWTTWMKTLNECKYGVHLMRTHAAGTFALNCAYLGIPCIGYKGLDTQEILHPLTTVAVGDLKSAKDIAHRLKTDKEFYDKCSTNTKIFYEGYNENMYVFQMNEICINEGIK